MGANKTRHRGTSQVVQGLRMQVPSAGGLGLIRGQETRSHVLELGPGTAKIKIIVKKKKKKDPHLPVLSFPASFPTCLLRVTPFFTFGCHFGFLFLDPNSVIPD